MSEFLGAPYSTPFVITREVNTDVTESVNFRRFRFSSTASRHKYSIPLVPQTIDTKFAQRLKGHQNGFGFDRSFPVPMPQFPGTDIDPKIVLEVGSYPTDRIPRDTAIIARRVPIVKVSGSGNLSRDILPRLEGRFISLGYPAGIHQVYYRGGESIYLSDSDFNGRVATGTININPNVQVFHDITQQLSVRYVQGILCMHTLNLVEDVDSQNVLVVNN